LTSHCACQGITFPAPNFCHEGILQSYPSLRASSDHSPSTFSIEGGLDWSPTARDFLTRPPTGTPRRAISPSEGSSSIISISRSGSGQGCPLLRASDDPHSSHRSFQACLFFLSWKGTHVDRRAAVERGPSQGARSGSTGPTWVSFQSFLSWGLCEQKGHLTAPFCFQARSFSPRDGA